MLPVEPDFKKRALMFCHNIHTRVLKKNILYNGRNFMCVSWPHLHMHYYNEDGRGW